MPEFMELLARIQFDRDTDTCYVLGDAIDRGDRPIDCLDFIRRTPHMHYILGNHDVMMLDHLAGMGSNWLRNSYETTLAQFNQLSSRERETILRYLRSRPYYRFVALNGRRFILVHAGLNPFNPLTQQNKRDLLWIRREFYRHSAFASHICVFGHTPTPHLHLEQDCAVWVDTLANDKICIDCGCVNGGALAALRLDDGQVFYVKANRNRGMSQFPLTSDPIPESFWQVKRPARALRRW
jgi:serine/threonine protein phosphatase 1